MPKYNVRYNGDHDLEACGSNPPINKLMLQRNARSPSLKAYKKIAGAGNKTKNVWHSSAASTDKNRHGHPKESMKGSNLLFWSTRHFTLKMFQPKYTFSYAALIYSLVGSNRGKVVAPNPANNWLKKLTIERHYVR